MSLKMLWTVFIAANAALIKGTTLRLSGSDDYGLIGEIFIFNCKIDGEELREKVQFKKNGTPVCEVRVQSCAINSSPGYNCGCDSRGMSMYLKIQNVDAEDEAIWSCFSSSQSNEVNLAVYEDLRDVVLSTYSLKSVNEGGDLDSVICSASCRPACSLVWYKNNTANIIPSSNGVLTFRDLNRTASGRYFCIATHTILNTSMKSPKLDLNVYYGPDAVAYNQTTSIGVTEGEAVDPISCKAECNPNCSISWYKQPNTVISNNNILHLINTNRSQSGTYYCQVFNNETKQRRNSNPIDIDIYYGPDAVSMNQTTFIDVTEGEAVGPISCKAQCNPNCSSSWYKQPNTVISNNNILHLINTNRSQSGSYYCQAFNTVTKQRSNSNPIDINVYFGPDGMSMNQTTSIDITEGEAVDPISCKAECNPNCSISWYKQPNTVISNNNILHLINTNRSQSGSYYCQAFNNVTKQRRNSNPIDIEIYYGPGAESLNQTTSIGVTEGEAVGPVSCKADCNPKCSFSWHKQPNTIISNNNILHLINTNRSQSGSYYCQAFNNETKHRIKGNFIDLDVYYGLDDILLNQTTSIDITEGEAVGPVSCKAECNPKCLFSWYKQPDTIISNNNILHLINTNRSQSGSYYCQAFNNETKQRRNSNPIDIDVYYGPGAVSLNQTTSIGVTEGEAVGPISCRAECNPECLFSWYKQPNTIISNNNILHLINTNRSQSGGYYCQVFNNETKQRRNSKPIEIDIYYGPEAVSLNQTTSIGVTEGEAVGPISCRAECNPECLFSWYKQLNTVISNSNILHLINTNRSQSGNYYCQVFNNVSKQRSSSNPIDISVYFLPEVIYLTTYEQIDRDTTNVTMNCEATSNPPATVSWFRDIGGKSIGKGNQYAVDMSCGDQRNYSCVAENRVGSPVSNTFSLNITCFASSPSTAQTPEVILNSTVQTTTNSSTVAPIGEIPAPGNSTLVYVLTGIIIVLVILIFVYCCIQNKKNVVKVGGSLLRVLCYRRNIHRDTGSQNTETGTENAFRNDVQRRTESNVLVPINNGQSSNGSLASPEAYNRVSSQTKPKYFCLESEEQSPCNDSNTVMSNRRELPKLDESEDSGSSGKPYKSTKMISAKINFYNMPNSGQDSDSSSDVQNDTNNLADVGHNPDNIADGAHDRGNNCNTTC